MVFILLFGDIEPMNISERWLLFRRIVIALNISFNEIEFSGILNNGDFSYWIKWRFFCSIDRVKDWWIHIGWRAVKVRLKSVKRFRGLLILSHSFWKHCKLDKTMKFELNRKGLPKSRVHRCSGWWICWWITANNYFHSWELNRRMVMNHFQAPHSYGLQLTIYLNVVKLISITFFAW